jgi:hypothetical protein
MTATELLFLSKPLQICAFDCIFLKIRLLMRTLRKNARVILSTLVLAAFFLPSYQGISGFHFISLAFAETTTNSEITSTDVLILTLPLILIPLTALGILLVSWLQISIRKTFTALPLLCLAGFTFILAISSRNSSAGFNSLSFLLQMGIGFYLALAASLVLPFTKNPLRKKVRRRRSNLLEPAV